MFLTSPITPEIAGAAGDGPGVCPRAPRLTLNKPITVNMNIDNFFKKFGAQRPILVARFVEDGADGGGLLISQAQFTAHLFKTLVHCALTRFSPAAAGTRSIEAGQRRAGHTTEHKYH